MFYFTVLLKVELLPLIGAELDKFSRHCEATLNEPYNEANVASVQKIARIQLKKVEEFQMRCYEDFRVSLVEQYVEVLRAVLRRVARERQRAELGEAAGEELRGQILQVDEAKREDIEVKSSTTQMLILRKEEPSPKIPKNRSQDNQQQMSKTSTKGESASVTNLTSPNKKPLPLPKQVTPKPPQKQTLTVLTRNSPPKEKTKVMTKVESKVTVTPKVGNNLPLKSPKTPTATSKNFKATPTTANLRPKPITKEQYIAYLSSSVPKK